MLREPPLPVLACVVAENKLAEKCVLDILGRKPNIKPLSLQKYASLSPLKRRDTVFVVDQTGLGIALGECIRQLRRFCPNARFLFLGSEERHADVLNLLAHGAHGFVTHAGAPAKLAKAVLEVAAKRLWVSPEAFHDFLQAASDALERKASGRAVTTPREEQILELVRMRLSNKEIAHLLHIQINTVKFHLSNILSKMNVSSRRELAPFSSPSLLFRLRSQSD